MQNLYNSFKVDTKKKFKLLNKGQQLKQMEYSYYQNGKITPLKIADALAKIYDYYVPVIVCVGTDSAIGDTLGPLIGTMLKEKNINAHVLGELGQTVTAKEIASLKRFLKSVYPLSKSLVIDAAVGFSDDVGKIKISDDGLKPGLGANKSLPKIGDGSIIGIVSPRSKNNELFINYTRFSPIYKMAETISEGIYKYVAVCEQKPPYTSVNGVFSKL